MISILTDMWSSFQARAERPMTTIAYKDGVIAYDSRCTRGTTILDDDANKLYAVKGVSFLCTGANCDFPALIDAFFGGEAPAAVEA